MRRNESNGSFASTLKPHTKRSSGGLCSRCQKGSSGGRGESFHQGPARELSVRYNTPHLEMAVAFAITTGLLARDTIPGELLEHLGGAMRFYEEGQAAS